MLRHNAACELAHDFDPFEPSAPKAEPLRNRKGMRSNSLTRGREARGLAHGPPGEAQEISPGDGEGQGSPVQRPRDSAALPSSKKVGRRRGLRAAECAWSIASNRTSKPCRRCTAEVDAPLCQAATQHTHAHAHAHTHTRARLTHTHTAF